MSGHLLLYGADITKPTAAISPGPVGEIRFPAGVITYRDVADIDDLLRAAAELRHMLREAQERHNGHQAIDLGVGAAMEVLIDPDCIAGKHQSCVGGPCTCSCHSEPGLRYSLPSPAPGVSLSVTVPREQAEIAREAAARNGIDLRPAEDVPLPDLPRVGHYSTPTIHPAVVLPTAEQAALSGDQGLDYEPLPDLPHRTPGHALTELELAALDAEPCYGCAHPRGSHGASGCLIHAGMDDGCRCDRPYAEAPASVTVYPQLSEAALAGETPLVTLAADPDDEAGQ